MYVTSFSSKFKLFCAFKSHRACWWWFCWEFMLVVIIVTYFIFSICFSLNFTYNIIRCLYLVNDDIGINRYIIFKFFFTYFQFPWISCFFFLLSSAQMSKPTLWKQLAMHVNVTFFHASFIKHIAWSTVTLAIEVFPIFFLLSRSIVMKCLRKFYL